LNDRNDESSNITDQGSRIEADRVPSRSTWPPAWAAKLTGVEPCEILVSDTGVENDGRADAYKPPEDVLIIDAAPKSGPDVDLFAKDCGVYRERR